MARRGGRAIGLVIAAALVAELGVGLLGAGVAGAQEPAGPGPGGGTEEPGSAIASDEPTGEPNGEPVPAAPERVRGTLLDKKATSGTDDDEPLAGVRITVTDDAGDQVGETRSDDDGRFVVPLPGPGTYQATIAVDDLPQGVELDEADATRVFPVNPGQSRPLIFDIGAAARRTEGKLDQFLQALADGAWFGLIVAMCAVGLSLVYGTTGLVNFAHGELVTLGAVLAYFLHQNVGWPLLLAAPAAVLLSGAAGWLLDAGFWGPIRRRGVGSVAQMVVSIGLALATVNLFLYFIGGVTRPYGDYHAQRAWSFGTVELAPKKLVSMGLCVVVLVAVAVALQRTRRGKAMRAIADNPDLASSSGIPVDSLIRLVWFFGAALAATGGVMFSVAQDVNFSQGSGLLLLLFAGITLGGLGEPYGALVGGFVVGLFVNLSVVWIDPEVKNVGALLVLILVLLVRPQGILGRLERVG